MLSGKLSSFFLTLFLQLWVTKVFFITGCLRARPSLSTSPLRHQTSQLGFIRTAQRLEFFFLQLMVYWPASWEVSVSNLPVTHAANKTPHSCLAGLFGCKQPGDPGVASLACFAFVPVVLGAVSSLCRVCFRLCDVTNPASSSRSKQEKMNKERTQCLWNGEVGSPAGK